MTTIDYDANGNPDTMTDPRGMTTITYDAQNRPTLITAPSGRQHELTYDNAGNVTGQRVHRSTSTGQKLIKSTKRFFDAENRLYASYTRDAQGKLLASLSYSYDENGNPTQRQTGSSDQRFAYDVMDRIKQVAFASGKRSGQADTYTYDAAGNRSTKNGQPYAYNALGQITSAPGGVTFAYDPQGRRTAKSTPAGSQTYSWDAFDQLTQSTSTDGSARSFTHDALGRLTAETAAAFTRTYKYQAGDLPSAITSTQTGPESSLTRTQRLTYGPGGLIESQLGSAAPTYPEADNVGTITAWTDEQGSVTQEPELDPFGELVGPRPNSTPSPVDQSPLTFTGAFGRQSLAGSDLVKMGARVYDPELGAFISRDPVTGDPSEPARRAPYAYAFNGPGRYLDLDGRSVIEDGWNAIKDIVNAIESGAGRNASDMQAVLDDPNSSDVEQGLAWFGRELNSTAVCDNLIPNLSMLLPLPSGKLRVYEKILRPFGPKALAVIRALFKGSQGIAARDGTQIVGFTRHGIQRAIGDGAKRAGTRPGAILDALKNPSKIIQGIDATGRPYKVFVGTSARVVVNPESGRIVSVNPLSHAGAHR